jgi:hypothetical protein
MMHVLLVMSNMLFVLWIIGVEAQHVDDAGAGRTGLRSARSQAARPPVRRRPPPTAARGEAGETLLLWAAIRVTAHRVALLGSRKQRQGKRSMRMDVPTVVANG